MSFTEKISKKMLVLSSKITNQRHMNAIRNTFNSLLPIIITGAICSLFSNVVCSTTTTGISLAKVSGMAWLGKFTGIFEAGNYASMSFLTIGAVLLIAAELGKSLKHEEFIAPIISLSCYITLCSSSVSTTIEGLADPVVIANALSSTFTGASGLFVGIIAAVLSMELYCKLIDSKKFIIKMPDSVPSNVSKSFSDLIPGVLSIIIFATFGFAFNSLFGMSFFDAITICIQKPLAAAFTGLPGYLLMFAAVQILGCLGIHGAQVLMPIFQPILLQAIATNLELVNSGKQATEILNYGFRQNFTMLGGCGVTLGLIFAVFIASKRDDYKAIAKLSLLPGLFNINEPMIFGMPIVLNHILMIPFIVTPLVTSAFAYFMTAIGFFGVMTYTTPWTTPPLLIAYLGTGGDIGAVITQLICIVIATLIYLPFVIIANKQVDGDNYE